MPMLRTVAAEIGVDVPEGKYLLGDRYLDIYPCSLQEASFLGRPERSPLRPLQFSEPGELPPIALAPRKRPLIYLTLGTVVGTAPALRAAVDGLSTLDADVVVAAGPNIPTDQFGALPGNIHLEGWVPQAELMPLVDLAVHHGGSATTLGASATGLPQLFLPLASDGFRNAGAVSATGAGRRLLPDGVERPEQLRGAAVVSAETIAEAAAELLTHADTRQAAKAVAEEIAAMPSPAEVATRLEAMPT
jgi:UDP:flavonoid glycosyltransferase YjiC (YdhE family)